ncbi:hypothetical protein Hanom_Chr05g00445141 [Helianthus anomalus]
MFLYVNIFSICSDMFDMFCTHMVMLPISIGLSMLLTIFSVRFCFVLVMSVLSQYLYWFVSVSSQYQS